MRESKKQNISNKNYHFYNNIIIYYLIQKKGILINQIYLNRKIENQNNIN
jgi:hypothetical protein